VEWLASTTWGLSKVEGTVSAIAHAHRLAGFDPPPTAHALVQAGLAAIRRIRGRAPAHPKAPLPLPELAQLLAGLDRTTIAGKRDAALLLVTWWSALRRSEVVDLSVDDVKKVEGGIALRIRRSKTDQEGQGVTVGIEAKGGELCPVAALEAWRSISGIASGPIFRGLTRHGTVRKGAMNDQEVARLVKRLAVRAGLDAKEFAGHSLRAGHVTEAYRQEVPEAQIMATTRHKSVTMLARYRREADPVRRSSSAKIRVPD
jgi:integrase